MYSAVLIVRDEQDRLPGALRSLAGAPELIVADTGSSDETPSLAADAGAHVPEIGWRDDFAWAREAAVRHATMNWVVKLDADERLVARRGRPDAVLRQVLSEADRSSSDLVVVRRHFLPGFTHWYPLAYRNGHYRWTSALHEHLASIDGERSPMASDQLRIVHRRNPRPRAYSQLAARQHRVNPDDAWIAFHLGRELGLVGRLDAAVAPLARALASDRLGALESSEAAILLARSARMRGDLHGAIRSLTDSLNAFPRREAALYAVCWLGQVGAKKGALHWLDRAAAIALPRRQTRFGRFAVPYLIDRRFYDPGVLRSLWRGLR
ncbi:MAG: glycosyltransferase [Planctomycetota bacterium]|nr:glycosyltransferase [Planctomycetota bacterium]